MPVRTTSERRLCRSHGVLLCPCSVSPQLDARVPGGGGTRYVWFVDVSFAYFLSFKTACIECLACPLPPTPTATTTAAYFKKMSWCACSFAASSYGNVGGKQCFVRNTAEPIFSAAEIQSLGREKAKWIATVHILSIDERFLLLIVPAKAE